MTRPTAGLSPPSVDWGVAIAPLPGESECGDLHVVRAYPRGALMAVVDGLGHGHEAANAARAAREVLLRSCEQSVISVVRRCHHALVGTRGVVMNLAIFSSVDDTISWIGIGNVEGVLVRADRVAVPARENILARGGVVGLRLPMLQASVAPVAPGDTLAFATDGIRPEFVEELTAQELPQPLADRIMANHFKGTDDALVFVARFLEPSSRD